MLTIRVKGNLHLSLNNTAYSLQRATTYWKSNYTMIISIERFFRGRNYFAIVINSNGNV